MSSGCWACGGCPTQRLWGSCARFAAWGPRWVPDRTLLQKPSKIAVLLPVVQMHTMSGMGPKVGTLGMGAVVELCSPPGRGSTIRGLWFSVPLFASSFSSLDSMTVCTPSQTAMLRCCRGTTHSLEAVLELCSPVWRGSQGGFTKGTLCRWQTWLFRALWEDEPPHRVHHKM